MLCFVGGKDVASACVLHEVIWWVGESEGPCRVLENNYRPVVFFIFCILSGHKIALAGSQQVCASIVTSRKVTKQCTRAKLERK